MEPKFIFLTQKHGDSDTFPIYVNVNDIIYFKPDQKNTIIKLSDGSVTVIESFEEVKRLLEIK